MNLLHLKYIVEVEKYGSISKAAHHLYMNQPHLSKIIREMEESMNIIIFERNSKGVVPTKKGRQFLSKAKMIIHEVNQLENMYQEDLDTLVSLDMSVPRASYISSAFLHYLNGKRVKEKDMKINYRETNTHDTIKHVYDGEDNIGIIRLLIQDKDYYLNMLALKNIHCEPLYQFEYKILMSQNNPLASQDIYYHDLKDQIELLHGDIDLPDVLPIEYGHHQKPSRIIHIYERASQLEILQQLENSYIWVSPMPHNVLEQYHLIEKKCIDMHRTCLDLLIYRKGYQLSTDDLLLIQSIKDMIEKLENNKSS